MSELSFEQLLEESLKTIRTGEVVTGTVIGVKEDEIILNIGYKSDGFISKSETTILTMAPPMEIFRRLRKRPLAVRKDRQES